MFNPQMIKEVYASGRNRGARNSSNIISKSHIKAISIIIVKSPRVIISKGKDKVFRIGFKK